MDKIGRGELGTKADAGMMACASLVVLLVAAAVGAVIVERLRSPRPTA
jgi:hypothetical protein